MACTLGEHARAGADRPAARPNFILLLSDDQGWDGLSVPMDPAIPGSCSQYIDTPQIARLAEQGMRFTQAYASAPVCSPTRAAIQTGLSPAQLRWTTASPGVDPGTRYRLVPPRSARELGQQYVTIAELLRDAGYMTAHYGKWHLGGGGPQQHGYDASDGDTANRDAAPFKAPNPVDIFGMGQRAAAFMRSAAQAGKPFFIQMSYYALHYPENALPETIEKYRGRLPHAREKQIHQSAMTQNLDTGVGELLQAIHTLGLDDRTYVIYLSDNGDSGRNGLLRGGKGTLLEGGLRVPFIVRGPGVKPNATCSEPVVSHDLLPTICRIASVKKALPEGIEGGDISHLFDGRTDPVMRRFPGITFHFPHYQGDSPCSAMRMGDHKIIHHYETQTRRIYNLRTDPGETRDVADADPELSNRLALQLKSNLDAVGAALPQANAQYAG
jgi:arylsulfatase A-like enzyme